MSIDLTGDEKLSSVREITFQNSLEYGFFKSLDQRFLCILCLEMTVWKICANVTLMKNLNDPRPTLHFF